MSDTPGGPDWFQATDGKWYAPHPPSPQFVNQKKKGGCLKWGGISAAVIVVLIVIAAIAGGGSSKKSVTTTTAAISQQAPSSDNPAINDVSITKCELKTEFQTAYPDALVAVTNHSSKTSDYYVTVAFDNPDGSQFDTGIASVHTLAAGQSGSDTARSLKEGAPNGITCKITDVSRTAS